MRTTIDLPESVYQRSEQLARRRGFSVEQLMCGYLSGSWRMNPRHYPALRK
jgi:hypothetical protein